MFFNQEIHHVLHMDVDSPDAKRNIFQYVFHIIKNHENQNKNMM